MSFIASAISKVPGLNKKSASAELDAFEEGQRYPLTDRLKKQLLAYFSELDEAKLGGYTFERRSTTYEGASYDLFVFDDANRLRFQGRAFHASQPHFWSI